MTFSGEKEINGEQLQDDSNVLLAATITIINELRKMMLSMN